MKAELTRRDFLKLAAAAAVAPSLLEGCSNGPKERVVNMFIWSNYIGKNTVPGFQKETGITVNLDLFSDEEEMFSKLKAGVQGYDLIVGTDYMIPKFKALDLIEPMPHDLLKNLGNVDKRFQNPDYDPGLAYTVPYLWGTTGIGFNKAKLAKPPSSWSDLWDPRFKDRISMLDNVRDGIGVALILLGLPIDTKDPAVLAKAKDKLVAQRALLKHYTSTTFIDELVAGELWLSQGWSGDVLQAARDKKDIDYVIPKDGSFIWSDSLCLIKGSEHREETLRFVDYLLRPEVAAEIAATVRYASPNAKAVPLLEPGLQRDPRVFPTPEMEKRLRFYPILDAEAEELWNRTWQEVKVA